MEGVETKDGVTVVKVRQVPQPTDKVKGVIQWVAKAHSVPAVVNLYNPLMTVEDVNTDAKKNNVDWLTYFNKDSLIVKPSAMVWNHHLEAKKEARFQFERVGYFYLISDPKSGKLEFNRIVDLRESTAKKEAGK